MKTLIKIILLVFVFQNLSAQRASKIDFDSIYSIINKKESEFEYFKLLNKFQKDSVLNDDELLLLYYGFTSQKEYNPYDLKEMKLQMFIKENGYGKTKELEEETFKNNHVSLIACYARSIRYKINNDTTLMYIWTNNYYGLLRAIKASGDGKTEETAFVTNSIADEYQILGNFKLNLIMQFNLGRYDGFELVEPNEFGAKHIYFDKIKSQEFLNQ